MIVTVFVFGCPGSGKSTTARCIEMLARDRREVWSAFRFNDYKILDAWFHDINQQHKFRPREYGGFDILAPELYDEALRELRREIQEHQSKENEFIIIEFARCDYQSALELFGKDFILGAYFLFLDAGIETCVQRIHERVRKQTKTLDDHFTSEFVFECYRQRQKEYIDSNISMLKTAFGVDDQSIKIIYNSGMRSRDEIYSEMKDFVDYLAQKHYTSPQGVNLNTTDLAIQAEEKDTGPLMPVGELERAKI